MLPVCQAYVADVSPPERRVINIGIFQGLAIGGAFIVGGPLGGILGKKWGPRNVLFLASACQFLSFALAAIVTPESLPEKERTESLDQQAANPVGALRVLFGTTPLLRGVAAVYTLVSLSRNVLDAQIVNYVNHMFGWSMVELGPVLVMTGVMLGVAPRLVVPRFGLRNSILAGTLVFALGQLLTGLAPTAAAFVGSIFVTSWGCACVPALTGLATNLAPPGSRGLLLGALGSITEATGAIGNTGYSRIFAYAISERAKEVLPFNVPGLHFIAAATLLIAAFGVALRTFTVHAAEAAPFF